MSGLPPAVAVAIRRFLADHEARSGAVGIRRFFKDCTIPLEQLDTVSSHQYTYFQTGMRGITGPRAVVGLWD